MQNELDTVRKALTLLRDGRGNPEWQPSVRQDDGSYTMRWPLYPQPVMAAVIPFWAGLGGVHPLAAFFPIGGALLLFPVYHSPGMGILCMALSLIGAVAGQEWKKRRETEKGKHHGGEKKRN